MATVTGYTAQRMKQIEDSTIIDGDILGDDLVLKYRDGSQTNAGNVRGPQGVPGPVGPTSIVVCTSSTRPVAPDLYTGLAIYETNTKAFYIYDGTAWRYSGSTWVCTSTTRPTAPFTGFMVFETDTTKVRVWNGSAWILLAGQSTPLGEIGYAQRNSNLSGVGGSAQEAVGVNVVVATGRKYRITGTFKSVGSDTNSDYVTVFLSVGTGFASIKEERHPIPNFILGSPGGSLVARYLATADNPSLHFGLNCVREIGTGNVGIQGNGATSPIDILVEDMGK